MSPGARGPGEHWGNGSDATAEDWHSTGGGASDGEEPSVPSAAAALEKALRFVQGGPRAPEPAAGDELGGGQAPVRWQRPVVDSVLLMSKVEEAPFKCVPMSMS